MRLFCLRTGVYKAVGGHFVISFLIPIKCVCNFVRVACWSAFVSPDLEVYVTFFLFRRADNYQSFGCIVDGMLRVVGSQSRARTCTGPKENVFVACERSMYNLFVDCKHSHFLR